MENPVNTPIANSCAGKRFSNVVTLAETSALVQTALVCGSCANPGRQRLDGTSRSRYSDRLYLIVQSALCRYPAGPAQERFRVVKHPGAIRAAAGGLVGAAARRRR